MNQESRENSPACMQIDPATALAQAQKVPANAWIALDSAGRRSRIRMNLGWRVDWIF